MYTYTVAFKAIHAREVLVEVHLSLGIPQFTIVGLANKAVAESRERIRATFHNMGMQFPNKRLVINLAPADLQKDGSHYDLPIALGILGALKVIDPQRLQEYVTLGELGLDGRIHRVAGVLPAAIHAAEKGRGIICPHNCGAEASWAGPSVQVLAIQHMGEIVNHMRDYQRIAPTQPPSVQCHTSTDQYGDMSDICGQAHAKRGLEIAACGGHHMLMLGPPGAGKSMLAQRLPSILPPMSMEEILDVTMIYSVASLVPDIGLVTQRPYRSPHHSASLPAMVGGGQKVQPGEISLAHHGVLFLDELPEFQRATLEALRQPLESGTITIARVQSHTTYPARIQLIAAMNPCACGYLGQPARECPRAPRCGALYQQRLSGPLLDRFDLAFHISAVPPHELMSLSGPNTPKCDTSFTIAQRVLRTHQIQYKRQGKLNALLSSQALQRIWDDTPTIHDVLEKAAQRLQLSARGYHRLLRVSQTIADLQQSPMIVPEHIYEALTFKTHTHAPHIH